jgi:hypothetical protein
LISFNIRKNPSTAKFDPKQDCSAAINSIAHALQRKTLPRSARQAFYPNPRRSGGIAPAPPDRRIGNRVLALTNDLKRLGKQNTRLVAKCSA